MFPKASSPDPNAMYNINIDQQARNESTLLIVAENDIDHRVEWRETHAKRPEIRCKWTIDHAAIYAKRL